MDLSLTVVIPVKDEAKNLPECLERLEGFGRVVVVDSGSEDATCDIARAAGAEVLEFTWDGRFPKKRNWILRNYDFKTDWVLFLDADEFVTPAFKAEVEAVIPGSSQAGYWLNYERWFLGKQLKHGDEFNKLALFRVGAGEYEHIEEDHWSNLDMEIHEHPLLEGSLDEIKAPIEHNEYRGLHHYIAKHNEYASWEANRYLRLMGMKGLTDHEGGSVDVAKHSAAVIFSEPSAQIGLDELTDRQKQKYRYLAKWWAAPAYFLRGYLLKGGFLDGAAGFHFALMKAIYFYQIRLKIREKAGRSID